MGLSYEIVGTKGTLVFDQERLSEIQLYQRADDPRVAGFRRIPIGPSHPDYGHFCPAPGHGTGYNDMVTIQLRDFITAITDEGTRAWPDFDDALAVHHVIDAALEANRAGHWVRVAAN